MIAAFPAAAALIALACSAVVGWDALQRPRPERVVWFVAFLVFAVAAATEVIGAAAGWNAMSARVYYLTGAVLVVGLLALGEAYLLWPERMPAAAPGMALLVVAAAATVVWSAPVDAARLAEDGWRALDRGPLLVALAVGINAGGTLVLVGGAIFSAVASRSSSGWNRRAVGCLLIAGGAILVATGGSLTRLGRPEYLYLAMSTGIAVIFAGVVLTRSPRRWVAAEMSLAAARTGLSGPKQTMGSVSDGGEGLQFIVEKLLPLDAAALADVCRRWSAAPAAGDALSREQARETWGLRVQLPAPAQERFDALPLTVQAQIAELYRHVWSDASPPRSEDARGAARRPLAILRPTSDAEGGAR